MKLNEIKNKGNWSDIAGQLNTNFGKISTEVDALNNATKKNKGFYPSLDALKSAHPTSSNGSIAYVKNGNEFDIYVYDIVWVATGMTYTEEVDLGGYYTKEEIDERYMSKEAGESLAEDVNVISGDISNLEDGLVAERERAEAKEQELSNTIGDWDKEMLGTIAEQVDSINGDVKVNQQDIAHNAEAIEAETERAKVAEKNIASLVQDNAGKINILNAVSATKVELNAEAERAKAKEQELSEEIESNRTNIDAIQKSVLGGEEKVVFDAYEVAVITPLTATQTAAGGSIVYVKNPNTDKANVNGFFYKLNDSYYWDAYINGVDVLLPFRDDERVLYPEKNYVCNGKIYYVDNNFLSLTMKSSIPVFEDSTEQEVKDMIANGTWEEGKLYITYEE